jgi:hypothetical protein
MEIIFQKDHDTVKKISRRASDRKAWIKLMDGVESPEPAINSVLDVPGEPARR